MLFNCKDLVAKQHPKKIAFSMQHNLRMHTREKSVCSEVREAGDVCKCGSSLYKSNIIVVQSTISLHFLFIKGGAHKPGVDASDTTRTAIFISDYMRANYNMIPARHNMANSSSSLPFCFRLHLV